MQECESKIAQEIASLSKEDVSKEEMTENEEEVINLLLAQVSHSNALSMLIIVEAKCHLILNAALTQNPSVCSGERDPDRAGGADLAGAGAAAADRHREGRD